MQRYKKDEREIYYFSSGICMIYRIMISVRIMTKMTCLKLRCVSLKISLSPNSHKLIARPCPKPRIKSGKGKPSSSMIPTDRFKNMPKAEVSSSRIRLHNKILVLIEFNRLNRITNKITGLTRSLSIVGSGKCSYSESL